MFLMSVHWIGKDRNAANVEIILDPQKWMKMEILF